MANGNEVQRFRGEEFAFTEIHPALERLVLRRSLHSWERAHSDWTNEILRTFRTDSVCWLRVEVPPRNVINGSFVHRKLRLQRLRRQINTPNLVGHEKLHVDNTFRVWILLFRSLDVEADDILGSEFLWCSARLQSPHEHPL